MWKIRKTVWAVNGALLFAYGGMVPGSAGPGDRAGWRVPHSDQTLQRSQAEQGFGTRATDESVGPGYYSESTRREGASDHDMTTASFELSALGAPEAASHVADWAYRRKALMSVRDRNASILAKQRRVTRPLAILGAMLLVIGILGGGATMLMRSAGADQDPKMDAIGKKGEKEGKLDKSEYDAYQKYAYRMSKTRGAQVGFLMATVAGFAIWVGIAIAENRRRAGFHTKMLKALRENKDAIRPKGFSPPLPEIEPMPITELTDAPPVLPAVPGAFTTEALLSRPSAQNDHLDDKSTDLITQPSQHGGVERAKDETGSETHGSEG